MPEIGVAGHQTDRCQEGHHRRELGEWEGEPVETGRGHFRPYVKHVEPMPASRERRNRRSHTGTGPLKLLRPSGPA